MGHPERVMPFCVRRFTVRTCCGKVVADVTDNHQTRKTIRLEQPVTTDRLTIHVDHPLGHVPASLFEVRCYAE
jgi:hypothetical protein